MSIPPTPRRAGKRYATFFDLRARKYLGQHVHLIDGDPIVTWCNAEEACEGTTLYAPQGESPLPVMSAAGPSRPPA